MIFGCYVLDLYCETEGCRNKSCRIVGGSDQVAPPAQYLAETGTECRQMARRAGWKLNLREGTALCPLCTKLGKKL